jgi:hypothetical protein
MKWVVPWLLPLGLLVTVATVSLGGVLGALILVVVGLGALPLVLEQLRANTHVFGEPRGPDDDTDYWRIRLR